MDCLIDYVGLSSCFSKTKPLSNKYLDILPGIKLKNLEDVSEVDVKSAYELWNNIQVRSAMRMESELIKHFNRYFKGESIIDYGEAGYSMLPYTELSSASERRGIYIKFKASRFMELFVHTIGLWSKNDVKDFELYINDVGTGHVLDKITVDIKNGFNTITIDKKYYPSTGEGAIYIHYLGNLIETVQTTVEPGKNCHCYEDVCGYMYQTSYSEAIERGYHLQPSLHSQCFSCANMCDDHIEVKGASIPLKYSVNKANLRMSTSTFGMNVRFDVRCSVNAFGCSVKDLFLQAWMYLCASEFALEWKSSSRINNLTTIHEDKSEELYVMYEQRYMEAMDEIFKSLTVPKDFCYECDPIVRSVYTRNL